LVAHLQSTQFRHMKVGGITREEIINDLPIGTPKWMLLVSNFRHDGLSRFALKPAFCSNDYTNSMQSRPKILPRPKIRLSFDRAEFEPLTDARLSDGAAVGWRGCRMARLPPVDTAAIVAAGYHDKASPPSCRDRTLPTATQIGGFFRCGFAPAIVVSFFTLKGKTLRAWGRLIPKIVTCIKKLLPRVSEHLKLVTEQEQSSGILERSAS
jgi:hypothetical protein